MLTSYSYASVASGELGNNVIDDILSSALQRNAELGVTGALYSDGETFFHVIEGEEPVLARLMSLILHDPRHEAIAILDQVDLESRMFGAFAIKHVDGNNNAALREKYAYRQLTNGCASYVANRVRELAHI